MRGILDMRGILAGVVTVTVGAAFLAIDGPPLSAQQAAPDQQPPAFRSGVEVVTVDVGVVDKQGRPMRGLTAADFMVTVAGQQRRVVTAEFVERAAPSPSTTVAASANPAQVSTNEGAGAGRLVRVHRRSEHARSRKRAARRGSCGSVLRTPDVCRSVGIDADAARTERLVHVGARSRARRTAARHRHGPPDDGLGVRQPGGRSRHHESQPDGPAHPGRAGVRRFYFGLLGLRGRGLDVRLQCRIPAVRASGVRRRNVVRR